MDNLTKLRAALKRLSLAELRLVLKFAEFLMSKQNEEVA
ncbi:hypothetical protein ES705_34863 [subsurface metagenome]